MKAFLKSLVSVLPIAGIIILTLGFWSCGGGGQNQAQKEKLKEVKQTTSYQIEDVIMDVEKRIRYVDGEIEKASGELKEQLEEAREELKKQKEHLNQAMKTVKDATYEGWSDALREAGAIIADARKKTNEVSLKVRNLLE